MSINFDEFLSEQMADSEFCREYEALRPARAAAQALIDARKDAAPTWEGLSEQGDIAKGDAGKKD